MENGCVMRLSRSLSGGGERSHNKVLESCIFTHKRINLDPYLTPFTKLTQMESDLKLRAKTTNLLEERGK